MKREADEEKRKRYRQEDLQRLKRFTPMDDTFMRCMFKDNLPLAQMVLRIILEKDDLVLTHCETQADMKRVTGARSICLDAYGTDSTGKKYNIEVQRINDISLIKRARYHSSILDVENLDEGQNFHELPDTYVIFITEKDLFGAGKAVYTIKTAIKDTDINYEDGKHILYVNGKYDGDDAIGRLMHDFRCSEAGEMNYQLMAERTRYLKENEKGVEKMCRISEEIREEGRLEGEQIGLRRGRLDGQNSIVELMQNLFAAGRIEDAKRATADRDYCQQLMQEFGIAQ